MTGAGTEGDGLAVLPPDEEEGPFAHAAADLDEVGFRELLEFILRPFEHLSVKGEKLVDVRLDVGDDFHFHEWSRGGLAIFTAEIFPRFVTELGLEIVLEILEIEVEPRARHTRHPRITGPAHGTERFAVGLGKILEHDHGRLETASDRMERFAQGLGHPFVAAGGSVAHEMAFAGGAADHEHAHDQRGGKALADFIHDAAECLGHAGDEVLVHHEEGLNRARLARVVLEQEIIMLELMSQRVVSQLVIAMVIGLVLQARRPGFGIGFRHATGHHGPAKRGRNRNNL